MKRKLFVIFSCMLMAVGALAENTKTINVTFSDYPKGALHADNEAHVLSEELTIYTTDCYFTSELRIYSNANNGFVISNRLPGRITQMTFKAAYESLKDVLNVYGSNNGSDWELVDSISITNNENSYKNYTAPSFSESNYTYFKLDVAGYNQLRIKSMSVTYITDDNNSGDNEGGNEGENEGNGEEKEEKEEIVITIPIFSPSSTTFESESLDVSISTSEGCDIFYTTDGTTPSYTDADNYNGTKGNTITIAAAKAPVILKAIAVDPATGRCSDISRAAYFYITPSTPDKTPETTDNDGSKEKPYTVAEVKKMVTYPSNKYVKGTIYGAMVYNDISNTITTGIKTTANIVIGDEDVRIPIQLTADGCEEIRAAINLVDHPYFIGKELLIKGDITDYGRSKAVTAPTSYQITYDVPINSFGYATLYLDMPAKMPAGSTAYYCTTNSDMAYLTPIEGGIIPDSVGVIIESGRNTTCTLTCTTQKNRNEESIIAQNKLTGFASDSVVFMDDKAYYALNAKGGKLGFYKPQISTDGVFVAKAYKAYLQVPTEQNVTAFAIYRKQDETEIVSIPQIAEEVTYDLQGRTVALPSQGIYIRGGKKIVIK